MDQQGRFGGGDARLPRRVPRNGQRWL